MNLKCLNCGAAITESAVKFCPYCGTKLPSDDTTHTFNHNKKNEYHYTREDLASIRRTESEERIYMKNMEHAAKEKREQREQRKRSVVLLLMVALLVVFAPKLGFDVSTFLPTSIVGPVSVASYAQYKGLSYVQVERELQNAGFINVEVIQEDVLVTKDNYDTYNAAKEGTVTRVSIDGDANFTANTRFAEDAKVLITYVHYIEPEEIRLVFNASEFEDLTYTEVASRFEYLGFVNIQYEVIEDLKTGWLTPDGTISQVSIAGDYNFEVGDYYTADTPIVIAYHTFKKDDEEQ